jgi:hypothetical protein
MSLYTTKAYRGSRGITPFLTLALDELSGQLHALDKSHRYPWIGGWVLDFHRRKYLPHLLGIEACITQPMT